MEKNCENNEVTNDLFIRVKAKKVARFKAGPELGKAVKMVAVEVSEEQTETEETLDLNIHIQSRAGSKLTKADSGKA